MPSKSTEILFSPTYSVTVNCLGSYIVLPGCIMWVFKKMSQDGVKYARTWGGAEDDCVGENGSGNWGGLREPSSLSHA